MNRITVDEVLASYERTGLTPGRGTFVRRDDDGGIVAVCALGAMAIDRGVMPALAEDLDITDSYMWGFIAGFDRGARPADSTRYDKDEFVLGREDGIACRIAVFPNG